MKEIKIMLEDSEHKYHKEKKGINTWKQYLLGDVKYVNKRIER